MTKLREQMSDEMVLRGLAPNTRRAYLQAVSQLARHYGRSPERISKREIKAYPGPARLNRVPSLGPPAVQS